MFSETKRLSDEVVSKIFKDIKTVMKGSPKKKHIETSLIKSLHYGQNLNKFFGHQTENKFKTFETLETVPEDEMLDLYNENKKILQNVRGKKLKRKRVDDVLHNMNILYDYLNT